jgi:hypothetical protein
MTAENGRKKPMPRRNKRIRWTGLKWVFTDEAQAELIAQAMLGQSNLAIRRDLEFTNNEINYALSRAKDLQGLPASIRAGWRDGTNPIVRRIKTDLLAVLRADIQSKLPKLILHPPATAAPNIDER